MTSSDSESVERAAEIVCRAYGAKNACFVSSGMAAIELALESLRVGADDNVLVADNVCHSIPAAIRRVGARPLFVKTDCRLLPKVSRFQELIGDRTTVAIAVHQFGLPFPVRTLRKALPPHLRIVEDCAQAFGIVSEGEPIGAHSNLVVTSFGPSKPVALGWGGALLGEDADIPSLMHRDRERSITSLAGPRPYTLPLSALAGIDLAIENAMRRLVERRNLARAHRAALLEMGILLWEPDPECDPSWHRFPVYALHPVVERALAEIADGGSIIQRLHSPKTSKLPQFAPSSARSAGSKLGLHEHHSDPYLIRPGKFRDFLERLSIE